MSNLKTENQPNPHVLVVHESLINMSSEVTTILNQILDYITAYLIPVCNFHYIFNTLYPPDPCGHQHFGFPFRLVMLEGWPHSELHLQGTFSCFKIYFRI
jgi:hypothetical protein